MPADQREIEDAQREPAGHPDHAGAIDRIGQLEVQRDQGDDDRQHGAGHAHRAAIGSLHVGELAAQQDEGQALHDVGEHRAEYRHVQQRAADHRGALVGAQREPQHEHHGECDHRAEHHRHMRRLAAAVGDRQPRRK